MHLLNIEYGVFRAPVFIYASEMIAIRLDHSYENALEWQNLMMRNKPTGFCTQVMVRLAQMAKFSGKTMYNIVSKSMSLP